MLVLLPPSEGKTQAPDGADPVELASLSSPGLMATRSSVLAALRAVSARADALEVLGVSEGLAAEVARNAGLDSAPAGPARAVYSGVLHSAAGLAALEGQALDRAEEHVRIVSALWGVVTPLDRIPAYRLSMGTSLPPLGPLASLWRAPLREVLEPLAADGLVVDCRSAPYQAAWRPGRSAQWVTVRVTRAGKVVSHHAKHTRGVLTGHVLARTESVPTSPDELLDAALELVAAGLVRGAILARGPRGQHVLELEVD